VDFSPRGALDPLCTGPGKLFGKRDEARFYWIPFNVTDYPGEFFLASYRSIEILLLPKLLAPSTKEFVCLVCSVPFYSAE
jgi:hypothetical protein